MKDMSQCKLKFFVSFFLILFFSLPSFAREAELLPNVDWFSGETIEIDGPWDFFWDRLIYPEEFPSNPLEDYLIPNSRFVPNFWSEKGFPVYGQATMRKVVASLSPLPDVIGLSFYSIYSAYQLYINGQLVMEKGELGNNRSQEDGDASRTVVYYTTNGKKELDIVILISNYSYKTYGGMGGPPILGERETIEQLKIKENALDYLLAGSLGFMAIFLISLYAFRKNFKSSLFLGLFSFVLVFRQLMISGGKLIFVLVPKLNVFWWDQFQPLVIYPLIPLLSWYVYSLFPQERHKKIILSFTGIFSVLMLFYWIPFSTKINNILFSLRDIIIFIGLIHAFGMAFFAVLKKQKEAFLVFAGMIFIIIVGINDILFSLMIIDTSYYLSYGVWIFLLFQSIILARRFSRAFTEVEVLSASLAVQKESLMQLDRMKDEFLANTSHELKTPLNGIIGITESLAHGDLGHLDAEQSRQLELVAMSGRRLFSLVNDILDHAQLNNHKLEVFPVAVDFWTFASPICEFFAFSAEAKGIKILCSIEPSLPTVLADPARLEQVLYNLLGNALKFTEKGTIHLSAWTDGREFHFSVKDSGIGIPVDKLSLVFEAFQQGDGSITRRFGGTGLGLTIVKDLVTLQNGTIRAVSEEGQGAEFIVTLPIAIFSDTDPVVPGHFVNSHLGSSAVQRSPEVHKSLNFSLSETPPLILIVDDEPINLQVLQNYLSASANRVALASDGQSALNMLAEGLNPDVVLLDVMMPGLSGYEVLSEIRKTHLSAELPVVLLTAKNQVEDMLKGFDLGANDFLSKPFSREELYARINSHIELKQIHDAYNRFVPFEFIRLLGKESLMDLRLGTQIQRDITVMFSDIRAFTTLSERLTPAESFSFINSYLSRFGPIIREHGGFVDKYIGDGIMALFPAGSDNALRASKAMRSELDTYNRHRGSCGYEPIEFGIGIHAGSVMMGTVGESRRMDTTVISDVVNLAARLENLTKLLHTRVLVSKSSLGSFAEIPSRFVGRVKIKGKKDLIEVCELLFEKLKIETLPLFNQAMNHFEEGSFMEAEESFSAVFAINSDDYIAGLYLRKSVIARKMPQSLPDLQFIDMEQI